MYSNHAVRQLFEGEVEKTRALLNPCGTRSAAAIYAFRLAGQPKSLTYLIKIDSYAGHLSGQLLSAHLMWGAPSPD